MTLNLDEKEDQTYIDNLPQLLEEEKFYESLEFLLLYIFIGFFGGVIINAESNTSPILHNDMIFFSIISPLLFYYSPLKFFLEIKSSARTGGLKRNYRLFYIYFFGFFSGLHTRFMRFYFSFFFSPGYSSVLFTILSFFFLLCLTIFYLLITENKKKNFISFFSLLSLITIFISIYSSFGFSIRISSSFIAFIYHLFTKDVKWKINFFFHSFFYGLMIEGISYEGFQRIF